jgi:zeta toxin family protein
VLEEAGAALPGSVTVNGDELRQFHPDYARLMREDPLRMPEVTASASGPWVGMSNEYLRERYISAVVETTLRQPDVLLREFKAFRQAGYETELRVVAVPLEVSRLGTVTRYLEQIKDAGAGRWTPGEHHDIAAAAVPGTVAALVTSGLVDRVVIQDRDGRVFHDARVSQDGPQQARISADAVERARSVESMNPQQAQRWLQHLEQALRDQAHLGEDDSDLVRVTSQLATADATEVVARAHPEDREAQQMRLEQLSSEKNALSFSLLKAQVKKLQAGFPGPGRGASGEALGRDTTHSTQGVSRRQGGAFSRDGCPELS